ncbi:Hypothetical protein R9X50_00686300 [Acrodontium crateriforme]|uniref:Chromosome transmission fidelity protein 8 n=1 Tax=Acrodontium crateriforme TaxID=150365 RepID=A0AAQ3MAG0_9PEZI|nr:Hypothetical protein R9X50_00686300 [Acrodontium crateriforme]
MPSIPIYPPRTGTTTGFQASGQKINLQTNTQNPLPTILQTPSGLALIEIQGTVNTQNLASDERNVGWLDFPLYDPQQPDDQTWMKKALLFVGKHQRLTGEVKKLPKPLGVLRRRQGEDSEEGLEFVDVVRYKVLFAHRPEPIGWKGAGTDDLDGEVEV